MSGRVLDTNSYCRLKDKKLWYYIYQLFSLKGMLVEFQNIYTDLNHFFFLKFVALFCIRKRISFLLIRKPLKYLVTFLGSSGGRYGGLTIADICKVPANIFMFKVNNRNTKKRCEIGSKLIMKTPEQHQ